VYISLSAFIAVRTSHEKVAQMREETELRVDNVTSQMFGRPFGSYVIAN
jgi:hypothetical protein